MSKIHERIKALREKLNLNKAELARKIGVNRASITYWEDGTNIPRGDSILKLALHLNTTPQYILYGENIQNIDPKTLTNYLKGRIPVMALTDIQSYLNKEFTATKYIEIEEGEEKNKFCIIMDGDSMTSQNNTISFPHGTYIVIDENKIAKTGDFVIAKITDINIFVVRKLIYDINKRLLQALNQLYQPIELDDKIEIIGVIVEQRIIF